MSERTATPSASLKLAVFGPNPSGWLVVRMAGVVVARVEREGTGL